MSIPVRSFLVLASGLLLGAAAGGAYANSGNVSQLSGTLSVKKPDGSVRILSQKSEVEDRLKGFEVGTDDYLSKPFSPDEMLFRIKAVLKRAYM